MAPTKDPNTIKGAFADEKLGHQEQNLTGICGMNEETTGRASQRLNDRLLPTTTTLTTNASNITSPNNKTFKEPISPEVNGSEINLLHCNTETLHEIQYLPYLPRVTQNLPERPRHDLSYLTQQSQLQKEIEERYIFGQAEQLNDSLQATENGLLGAASQQRTTNGALGLQKSQLVKFLLKLTAKTDKFLHESAVSEATSYRHGVSNMDDVVVNSASLEDVALSEMSDNRAQSIQSLHSIETPTPDTTPSYDELQQRLESSNRNIQSMQEQQQQLLRLQNAAKQHLSDMEHLREQTGTLSFSPGTKGVNDAPDYESIDQVHSDMATLVGRMKNLTTFIQGQNELSNILGDDGPEILAEQEALQQKLESLRMQRDEMRHLVDELQDINRSAEESANVLKNGGKSLGPTPGAEFYEKPKHDNSKQHAPKPYSRNVPIQLTNGTVSESTAAECISPENAAAAMLIQQKVADIDTMRLQLKRLKDMMETVNMIEARTERNPQDIGRTPPHERRSLSNSTVICNDRERTPVAVDCIPTDSEDNNDFIARKVRMLNDVTSDLRAQAESLQAERDRIKALKEEIVLRKAQAAAAAQLGEDALKRNSVTPTPMIRNRIDSEESAQQEPSASERDVLKREYEEKKKEFEKLCKQLEDNSVNTSNERRRDTVSEADDEADGEELNDSDYGASNMKNARNYYTTPQTSLTAKQSMTNTASKKNTQHMRESKDSFGSTLSSVHAESVTQAPTLLSSTQDGGSNQSASSQSYSLPPAMPPMGACSSWPPLPPMPQMAPSWNQPLYYGFGMAMPPPLSTASTTTLRTPGNFSPPSVTTMQSNASGTQTTAVPTSTTGPNSGSDCIGSTANSTTTMGARSAAAASTASATTPLTTDPVLMQQFVQTQQMLINSVCQCNQMLWHQQREIDTLNNTVHFLQDRIYALTGGAAPVNEGTYGCRAESVPPPTMAGALPNNVYNGGTRAQSEQPMLFFSTGMPTRGVYSNYHQQQQFQRQRGVIASAGGYNYSAETHQQNASSSNTLYSTLNNAVPPPSAPQFNNEAPQSPLSSAGPGPIFMHHHNNAIHQNNANLRTQNHHANNLHQQQQHSNISSGSNTLNNQVPPGNRANNYWDNFRSYSRQNLLSTNSNKSNEDHQNQNQQQLHLYHDQGQQRLQERHVRYQQEQQQQRRITAPQQQQQRPSAALTATNLEHLQQQLPPRLDLFEPATSDNTGSTNYNNLNCERNDNCSNKYIRAMYRSRINQYQQQQQQHQHHNIASSMPLRNCSNLYRPTARLFFSNTSWPENAPETVTDATDVDSHYGNFNIVDGDSAALTYTPPSSSNLRNMNVNFGNSPHNQRNKVLPKPTCSVNTASSVTRNQNDQLENQQMRYLRNVDEDFSREQSHFRNIMYSSVQGDQQQQEQQQHRFLELLPTTTQNSVRNCDRTDLLLRTVAAADVEEDNDFGQNVLLTNNSLFNGNTTGSDIVLDNSNSTNNNDENEDKDEDDDDTTSEEIKRNLLVNALKNDKFTTKFYESIKEDVFRRLESMLLEKEPSNCQRSQQLPSDANTLPCNGSDIACETRMVSPRDPMRKLYLNARMGSQQQRQTDPTNTSTQQTSKFELKAPGSLVKEFAEEETEELNNAETESNNAEVYSAFENEKPEEDGNECFSNDTLMRDAPGCKWRRNVSKTIGEEEAGSNSRSASATSPHQSDCGSASDGAYAMPLLNLTKRGNENNENLIRRVNSDLVSSIIIRIKNQTHANTLVSDGLLVDIAKLTANTIHDLIASGQLAATSPHISPKRIYAKIKKLSVSRRRDEFLNWYEKYLETLLPVTEEPDGEQQQQGIRNEQTVILKTNNIPTRQQKEKPTKLESACNVKIRNGEIEVNASTSNAIDVDDADLAEADQNSANASGGNASSQLLQVKKNNVTKNIGEDSKEAKRDTENAESPKATLETTSSIQKNHDEANNADDIEEQKKQSAVLATNVQAKAEQHVSDISPNKN